MVKTKPLKIAYCTPSLYIAGGVERVLTMKASYLAERLGYDVTIILTDGRDKPPAYPLSPKVRVINLDIGFEELWGCPFLKKVAVYLRKQRVFKRKLRDELMRLRPDITVSLLRREINFICDIPDGSRKMGELHVSHDHYRNFEENEANPLKQLFAYYWMKSLERKLRRLDRFVVLTHEDAVCWKELPNVQVIPDPLSLPVGERSPLTAKRVVAVGRYTYQKGFDLLLQAWAKVHGMHPDWQLHVYGAGNRQAYEELRDELGIDASCCQLHGATADIRREYLQSSIFVFSSRFEGFGMVLLEAMSCGLPVVSFDCPCGPKDIIDDGHDGILVPTGDVDQLACQLGQLIEAPKRRQALGVAAQKKASQFTMEQLALEWQKLFERLKVES